MPAKNPPLHIRRLHSGGLITNYTCTSRCGHCLYGCSPQWPRDYIDPGEALAAFHKIKSLGCHAVHVGGGEPFLDLEGLKAVLAAARDSAMHIDYVETNSSWYRDQESTRRTLKELQALGLTTLLVSMSPFHNEHIPFDRVKGVLAACRATGMGVFPWISDFYREIASFDTGRRHSLAEYEAHYGDGYLRAIPSRYWVHFGGRALATFARILDRKPVEAVLAAECGGCRELAEVNHFHLDLYGNYIPGLCAGLAVRRDDLGAPLPADRYLLIDVLYRAGIAGLYQLAIEKHGFEPAVDGYLTKCHLCFHIRSHLVLECGVASPELQPAELYRQV